MIFPEGALILMLGLVAAPQKILRLRSVIGEPPDSDRATRGFERGRVILFVVGGLCDFELVFGSGPNPLAPADWFINPAFARTINERRRAGKRKRQNADNNASEAN